MTQLLFDYGQVISTAQRPAALAELAELAGLPAGELARRYWAHRAPYDRGGSARDYWTAILGAAPAAGRLARLVDADTRSWLEFDAGLVELLDALRTRGVPLSLLSNAPHELARALRGRSELAGFRHLLFSAELGLAKPDPAIFHAALARLGAEPGQVVFVDDRAENTAAAAALGLRTITYAGTPRCRTRIRDAGLDEARP